MLLQNLNMFCDSWLHILTVEQMTPHCIEEKSYQGGVQFVLLPCIYTMNRGVSLINIKLLTAIYRVIIYLTPIGCYFLFACLLY